MYIIQKIKPPGTYNVTKPLFTEPVLEITSYLDTLNITDASGGSDTSLDKSGNQLQMSHMRRDSRSPRAPSPSFTV